MVHAGREAASGEAAAEGAGEGGLRPEAAGDAAFLAELFHLNAMMLYGEAAAALEPMIALQHRSQMQAYAAAFPGARSEIITIGDQAVGRLLTDQADAGIHVVDIAVLPAWRKRGLARAALGRVLSRAREAGLPVTARVIVTNAPSLALFTALGFAWSHADGEAQALGRWAP